jgi:hypothetical protein
MRDIHRDAKRKPNQPGLIRRSKRFIRGLITGREYKKDANLPSAKIMSDRMLNSHAWCRPLNEPADWRGHGDYGHMRADDPVLGIYLEGKAWALPWWIMKNHHVANVVLEGQPVLVTLCEVCSSASAFLADPDERYYNFRLAGLYNGTNLITDLETGSLWNPFLGEAISGPELGVRLQRIALAQCQWREWLDLHPGSSVLWDEQDKREGHGSAQSPGSPGMGADMRETLLRPIDSRLEHNTLVLGVEGDGIGQAFPLTTLDEAGPVLHAKVDGEDIVILHLPGSLHALAYQPELHGKAVHFVVDENGVIVDEATGSRWNYVGECYAGELTGEQLKYVSSGVEEWYIWAAYHPSTDIFTLP